MKSTYILSIDQGTTGTTALIVDMIDPKHPVIIAKVTVNFQQYYPQTGWVEHDLDEVWHSVKSAVQQVVQLAQKSTGFRPEAIATIGITNQRETLCVFDPKTGQPLTRAIVWQCRRSARICEELKSHGYEAMVRERTGLVIDPYFSGTKITWLMRNDDRVKGALTSGRAVCGTIDSYLVARLTGGASFVTEASNASRTLLFNIETGAWDPELCKIFEVPSPDVLPQVLDSNSNFGVTKNLDFLPDGIPICAILGDQQAALAGQTCFAVGESKCTYGTGAFLLVNLGEERRVSQHGLLTTVAWSLEGKLTYAMEGASFIAGAAIQFIRDQMGLLESAQESQKLASQAVAAPEVYFVPALAGLGAPYWDPNARGSFLGLTRGTSKNQLIRATLEGIAFQVNDLLQSMQKDCPVEIKSLRVDGGASANDLLMQMQANFSQVLVDRPVHIETTAIGAALFAGLGKGLYSSLDDMADARHTDSSFKPQQESFSWHLRGWEKAVKAVRLFTAAENDGVS